jgi:hypothetical protein
MSCQRVGGAIVCGRGPSRINEKVEHVRRSTQTRQHNCHWPGCNRQVPPAKWGCAEHWYRLPPNLRAWIWRAYQVGQEESGRPGEAYLVVAREAQAWIAENVGRPQPTSREPELPL